MSAIDTAVLDGRALAPATAAARTTAARHWLWATVLLTLGGFAVAIMFAPPPGSSQRVQGLTWLVFIASSVHVATSGWLYALPEVRAHLAEHRARFIWLPVAVIATTAAAALLVPAPYLRWLLLGFFGWQFFHFQKQNLGVAALAASSAKNHSMSLAERWALIVASSAGTVAIVVHPGLLRVNAGDGMGVVFPVALAVFGCAVAAGATMLICRPRGQRSAGYCVTYMISLLFFAPAFVFDSPYAAVGGMTIAHGLQYILLVGLVASANQNGHRRAVLMVAMLNGALVLGAALSTASHLHDSSGAGRFIYGAFLGVVMMHFLFDSRIWRLRDPFPRAFLSARVPYLVAPAREPISIPVADRSVRDIK